LRPASIKKPTEKGVREVTVGERGGRPEGDPNDGVKKIPTTLRGKQKPKR